MLTYEDIAGFVVSVLRQELIGQGHSATGRLAKSIDFDIKDDGLGALINIVHEEYGIYVNTGVRPERVPFTLGSGAKSSKFITALIKWVLIKGIAPGFAKAKGIAFAIAKNAKKEGIPSKGSYKFSNNGRRTGWIDHPSESFPNTLAPKAIETFANRITANIEEFINTNLQNITIT